MGLKAVRNATLGCLSKSDGHLAARLISENYRSDPGIQALLQSDRSEVVRAFSERLGLILVSLCLKRGYPLAVKVDGELAGVGLYYLPGTYPVPLLIQLPLLMRFGWPLLFALGLRSVVRLLRAMAQLETFHPKGRYLYAEIMCVDERFRGQGIATIIRDHINTIADQEQVGIYSETSNEKNVQLWQRYGSLVFRVERSAGATYWLMWREPRERI